MKKIAIFASGSGSNAENIIRYFACSGSAEVVLVAVNNPSAYVLERARGLGVATYLFNKEDFYNSTSISERLVGLGVDCVVLAGFLWLLPPSLIEAFPCRIINIHPALLPKYGGKGMYGDNVHRAVVAAGESRSGITIHLVDEHYDSGSTIAQFSVELTPSDTPQDVAAKIHELEQRHFPRVIDEFLATL